MLLQTLCIQKGLAISSKHVLCNNYKNINVEALWYVRGSGIGAAGAAMAAPLLARTWAMHYDHALID